MEPGGRGQGDRGRREGAGRRKGGEWRSLGKRGNNNIET